MSEDERPADASLRLGPAGALRYRIIDVLESRRGRRAAAIAFLAWWCALAAGSPSWGALFGWVPAAVLGVVVGYVCR